MDPVRGATGSAHFIVLDSLRGICALAVCLYHFRTTGIISNLAFVRHSWLFVDFFFVLSGFVIAAAYGGRIAERTVSVPVFMWLRLGRIYPLHLAVLVAMIALEILLVLADFSAVSQREGFTGSRSISAIGGHLLMLHTFGLYDVATWNVPSWSIAAEMWAYLLFALVCVLAGRQWPAVLWPLGAFAGAWLLAYSPSGLDVTYDFGFARCLFGFAIGTMAYTIFRRNQLRGGTWLECLATVAVIAFVTYLPGGATGTLLAPFLFAAAILVFACEGGAVSRAFQLPPFVWLGAISYSTYMVHSFVQARIGDFVVLAGARFGLSLAQGSGDPAFPSNVLSGQAWMLDLLGIAMLGLVIAPGSLSYIVLERPLREWSRQLASRRFLRAVA